jgi:hypothetical protein
MEIVLNQEFSIGHNFAFGPSICKIQKGADRENSEFFCYVYNCKYCDLSTERSTFNRRVTKDIIAILTEFMKEHMF